MQVNPLETLMSKLSGPIVAEYATWLSIVSQLFSVRMNTLLNPHNLTLGQFSILHHVARRQSSDGNRVSDIAAAVEVGQPAVTKALQKFQAMGLVDLEISQSDKRSTLVVVRPAAAELMDAVHRDIGPDLFRAFASLGDEEAAQFAELLKRLGKWLDKNRLLK